MEMVVEKQRHVVAIRRTKIFRTMESMSSSWTINVVKHVGYHLQSREVPGARGQGWLSEWCEPQPWESQSWILQSCSRPLDSCPSCFLPFLSSKLGASLPAEKNRGRTSPSIPRSARLRDTSSPLASCNLVASFQVIPSSNNLITPIQSFGSRRTLCQIGFPSLTLCLEASN